jgi:DNA (cytosine-5)-methyltransferase 1
VWANDIDPKKASVYRRNFGDTHFELGDVAKFSASDLPNHTQLAWASFPCQDISLAGWQRGLSADRSGTFWAFWKTCGHSLIQANVRQLSSTKTKFTSGDASQC